MRFSIVLGLLLLPLVFLGAQVSVVSQDSNELVLQFTLPEYKIGYQTIEGTTWNVIETDEGSIHAIEGFPELRVFSEAIAIPVDGEISIQVLDVQSSILKNINLKPIYKMNVENEDVEHLFFQDSKAYRSQQMWPISIAETGEAAFIVGERNAARGDEPKGAGAGAPFEDEIAEGFACVELRDMRVPFHAFFLVVVRDFPARPADRRSGLAGNRFAPLRHEGDAIIGAGLPEPVGSDFSIVAEALLVGAQFRIDVFALDGDRGNVVALEKRIGKTQITRIIDTINEASKTAPEVPASFLSRTSGSDRTSSAG